jgi:Spy/CpxP family protein refolding chaperone
MRPSCPFALLVVAVLAIGQAAAEDVKTKHHSVQTPPDSPYSSMADRTIKALSAEQIADLRSGRGMGLALAAELNGYPGPSHVLDLADALQLTDEQRARTKALFDGMKTETIPIGERIIAEEAALDRLFAERSVTRAALETATGRIAIEQGALRAAHLRYHMEMVQILSPGQVGRYAELRGYVSAHGHD